jgi:hypothetical protein
MDMTQVASTSCDNAKAPEKRNIIKEEDRVNNGKLQARISMCPGVDSASKNEYQGYSWG